MYMEPGLYFLQNNIVVIMDTILEILVVVNFFILIITSIVYSFLTKCPYRINQNSMIIVSSLLFSCLLLSINQALAVLYIMFSLFVIFIHYTNNIRTAINNNAYNDEVCCFIAILSILIFILLRGFSTINSIVLDWFKAFMIILYFILDVYFLLYICYKILDKLFNSDIVNDIKQFFIQQSRFIQFFIEFAFSPLVILKLFYELLKSYYVDKSLLDYFYKMIVFAIIFSFMLVYFIFGNVKEYTNTDKSALLILVTAVLLPLLLSYK